MSIVCTPDPVVSLTGIVEGSSLLLSPPAATKDWRRCSSSSSTRRPFWVPHRMVAPSSIRWPALTSAPKYSCQICGKEFTRRYSVKVHQRDSHFTTPDTVFRCRHCGRTATTQKALKMHVHRYHRT